MHTKRVILLAVIIGIISTAVVFLLNGGKADWFDLIGTIIGCTLGIFVVLRMQKKQA
ncbi:hypothetical protein BN2127_JRS7_00469 [Bacillus subtilis]|uniref:hypothetical protein n=1 Tax=Bacillus spizizenii TaxID=96241 RepID=UPI0006A93E1B|nr:hypothetical protein [Bacillus spizizenii]CUB20265.1 hypothetical protein BN2127_JRS1_06590 [Bacillus cereus]CUB34762.1 hypothetical protein BN2127_JRS7_00469 [Bacillus subtilis]MEC1585371.1 hypothetical protein [Bacillus spizizenii]OWV35167.1 hypothetical protein CE489_19995 [Bacillus spizizenii]SCV37786.1 FIG01234379: hypothetical protein [Bacillus subtilis]